MSAELQEIDAVSLKAALDKGEALLVDVREPAETARERIPNAVLMPLSSFDPAKVPGASGKRVVLYCASGNRSSQAAQRLLAHGADTATHLKGGIGAWKQAGHPVTGNADAPLPLMRQVQIVAGTLALSGVVLGFAVDPAFFLLSGMVGAGLMLAGITGNCMMANLLMKLPYNKPQRA